MTPIFNSTVTPQPDPTEGSDNRFTIGLLSETFTLLERHGYSLPTDRAARNRAHADAMVALLNLTRAFEGREV